MPGKHYGAAAKMNHSAPAKKYKNAAPKMKHSSPTEMNHAAPTKNLKKGYHGVKPNPPANMGSAYKMKNSVLHMGAKHGTPIHANYASPAKGNAFIGAKMAAEKAGKDTFTVDGKTFNVTGGGSPADMGHSSPADMGHSSPADMYGKSPAKEKKPLLEPGSNKSMIIRGKDKDKLEIIKDDSENMRTLVSNFKRVNASNYPEGTYKQTDEGVGDVFITPGKGHNIPKTS